MYCTVNQTVLERWNFMFFNLIVIFLHCDYQEDLIFYCFLDQIRMTCLAAFSYLFAYMKIIY